MPYQSWSLIIFNVPIYGWLFHLIWVQLLTQIAAGEIRGNSGVKSWASLSWPETQTEGSIQSCRQQLPSSPFHSLVLAPLPFFQTCFFPFLKLLAGGSIFCFSFLGSDKMINDTNIGPDRAFEVRQRIKTKLEPKFLFIFMMWSILLS